MLGKGINFHDDLNNNMFNGVECDKNTAYFFTRREIYKVNLLTGNYI